jgi:uncharacterized membrane protein YphA (DoxX/SURF4 family)
MKTPTWQTWIGHLLAGIVALVLLMAGVSKLAGAPEQVAGFEAWGFPPGFVTLVGALEVLGAILLVVPRSRLVGAAIVLPVMLGAVATHVLHDDAVHAPPAAVLAVFTGLAAFLAWRRRG